MADFQAPVRRKIALDHNKLKLNTKCPSAEGKYSNLIWGINKNNPRITVYTGDPADNTARTGNGRIQAELDLGLIQVIFQLLEQANTEQPGWKKQIKCFNYTFFGGKRSDKPANTTDIWIGKDKEGLTFISLVDAMNSERPVIKFPIAPEWIWFKLFNADGSPVSKEEASNMFTKGYVSVLRDMYTHLAITEFVPYEPQPKNNGGGQRQGGGGYNNNGGGQRSGGYNNNSGGDNGGDIAEDSLPF